LNHKVVVRLNHLRFLQDVRGDLSKVMQRALEVDYRKTDYTQILPNAFFEIDDVLMATRILWWF